MAAIGSHIWTLGPQLVELCWVGLDGMALLEVCHTRLQNTVCLMTVSQDVSSNTCLPACLCSSLWLSRALTLSNNKSSSKVALVKVSYHTTEELDRNIRCGLARSMSVGAELWGFTRLSWYALGLLLTFQDMSNQLPLLLSGICCLCSPSWILTSWNYKHKINSPF